MTSSPRKVGIIAGSGELPLSVARSLAAAGKELYIADLDGAATAIPDDDRWKSDRYSLYEMQALMDGLRSHGVDGVVLAGKVAHSEVFRAGNFDGLFREFLSRLEDNRAATILGGIVNLLKDNGMEVLSLNEVVPDLMPAAGLLAGPSPGKPLPGDLEFGWRIARSVADLDIGQTVIVKDRSVVAVEAMEGTDIAIKRAIEIAGGGVTVVKLAARHHDFRFDVPTIGKETVSRIAEGGGGTLVVESGRCVILGYEDVAALCEEAGVTLLSCEETGSGEILWDAR